MRRKSGVLEEGGGGGHDQHLKHHSKGRGETGVGPVLQGEGGMTCPRPECPLPTVVRVPTVIPFVQPAGRFVSLWFFCLLLTATLKGGETGFMTPTLQKRKQ